MESTRFCQRTKIYRYMVEVENLNKEPLHQMNLNTGETLFDYSLRQPVLLVFLRHFGCTFCREALADISKQRELIESQGSKIVFVHMTSTDIAERYFNRYGLDGAMHISDPECKFYAAFGLVKGNFTQLFGLST